MYILTLSLGSILLVLIICDFFYTTLSGSGAGFISKPIASFSYRIVRIFSKFFGRKIFDHSGMIVNLSILFVWIMVVWFGLFLVYSYDPAAITNSSSRPANWVERLFFTGYILSTLGLGNFKPVTPFFEIVTSIFSFFGFIFFTSSMTYLISVSSAVIRKRSLSRSISNLGKSPGEITKKLKDLSPAYRNQQLLSLQEQIDNHAVSHQAYPVVHFFSHQNPENCFSLNFTRLDEALRILSDDENKSETPSSQKEEIKLLRSTMTNLLLHLQKNFSDSLSKPETDTGNKNEKNKVLYHQLDLADLDQRRELLSAFLRNEGFSWEAVNGK